MTTRTTEEEYLSVKEIIDCYRVFVKENKNNKVYLGYPTIDKKINGLRPKEILTIIANTGAGKSAIAQNILMNFAKQTNKLVLLFSLEMSLESIAERLIQIELDLSNIDVEEKFIIGSDEEFLKYCNAASEKFKNFITTKKRIDVNDLKEFIREVENDLNNKVGIICVDYISLLKNKNYTKDEYSRITNNMEVISDYARDLNIPMIIISQVARFTTSNPSLSLYSAKGSGQIENSSDFLLALKKSDKTSLKSEIELLDLMLLKNKRGGKTRCVVELNKKNLRIKERRNP